MSTLADTFLRLARCFVWSPGLRDAIAERKVCEYLAFKKHFRERFAEENRGPFARTLAAVAVMKDEGPYLAEWLEYHRLVGVEKFYLYDNGSTDQTAEVLALYIKEGLVELTPWPYRHKQIAAYNDCLAKHRLDTKWLAVIDLDEFIVPVARRTIPEILKDYEGEVGLAAHWVYYGDNGHTEKTPGLVMERFTARAAEPDEFVKAIVNPRACFALRGHHGCFVGSRASVNELGVRVRSQTGRAAIEKIRINHYWCKSWEEYLAKARRGRADDNDPLPVDRSMFDARNRNDVQDPIMKPYVQKLKAILGCALLCLALATQAEAGDHPAAVSTNTAAIAATNLPPALTATAIPLDQALRKTGPEPSRFSLDLRAAMPAGPWSVSADPDYLERHEHDLPYYPQREEFIGYTGVKVSF